MKMVSPLRKMWEVGSTDKYPPALWVALRPPLGYEEPSVSPEVIVTDGEKVHLMADSKKSRAITQLQQHWSMVIFATLRADVGESRIRKWSNLWGDSFPWSPTLACLQCWTRAWCSEPVHLDRDGHLCPLKSKFVRENKQGVHLLKPKKKNTWELTFQSINKYRMLREVGTNGSIRMRRCLVPKLGRLRQPIRVTIEYDVEADKRTLQTMVDSTSLQSIFSSAVTLWD